MKIMETLLEIVDIALPDSYGVGKKDGFVYFVKGAVPGDRVRVRVTKEGKKFSYGEIIDIDRPSPDRCQAPCTYFGLCGGCTLQHLSYEKQLEVKERHLAQTLARIGGIDVTSVNVRPIIPSPKHYFSRNKIEMSFGRDSKGIVVGLRERSGPDTAHEGKVVSLGECLAFSDSVERILPPVLDFLSEHHLPPYDPATGSGFVRRLILRESKLTADVMAILETTHGALPDAEVLWRTLNEKAPEVKSLWRGINTRRADAGFYEKEEYLFGKRFIEEAFGDLTFRIYPQSFFQPNTGIAETLYRTVTEFAGPGPSDKVLGLYCGMGPMEMMLSRNASSVTGVDSNPENITRARENAKINGIENCTFIEGKVETIGDRLPPKPGIVVIDPPRSGISNEGQSLIVRLGPEKLVYVSCNPSTLARDLKNLKRHAYLIREIASFDAFPQTGHLETVALVERQRAL